MDWQPCGKVCQPRAHAHELVRPSTLTSYLPGCPPPPGAVKPHHVVAPEGAVLGWSHLGMLAAARWVLAQTKYRLASALAQHPDHGLIVAGEPQPGGGGE